MTTLKQMILMPVLNRLVIKPSVSYVIKRISLKRVAMLLNWALVTVLVLIHKRARSYYFTERR